MKIQLTKSAKQELKSINVKIDKTGGEYYDQATKREKLVLDAMLYIEDAYVSNKFKQLDSWCKRTGEGEYQKDYRINVKKKIGKMLIEDIITIVE
jgi:hypothetical protein